MVNICADRLYRSDSFKQRPTAAAAEKWKPYFENDNPYFIAQGSNGFSYYIMRYELAPYSKLANIKWDYSISLEPYFPELGDPWTFIITPETWEKYVLDNGYKLVYVYKSDEILETTYGQFFPYGVKDNMCYYVQTDDNHMSLVPVY
jgi:hypothetical protein